MCRPATNELSEQLLQCRLGWTVIWENLKPRTYTPGRFKALETEKHLLQVHLPSKRREILEHLDHIYPQFLSSFQSNSRMVDKL